jgi:hypothetical protein
MTSTFGGKGTLFALLVIMFKLSSKQHCTTISRRVVHQVKGLIGVNFFNVKQHNPVTQSNL